MERLTISWGDFAKTIDMVSDLSNKGFIFQFLSNSIIIYHNEDIICFCDSLEEFAEALEILVEKYGGE